MSAAPASPTSRIGAYVVGRRIGVGGMAVVDAAHQVGPAGARLVALKRIAAAFSDDPSARRLFLREASIVTRLEHPNVVRTYDVGEIAGEAFIAMELLEGGTVSQLRRATDDRIPLPIALRIVRDALRGLHAAHELRAPDGKALGLVHQDISPQNLHVAYEGTTRILDFGVARLTAIDASRTDSVRGKPCYLAPEQLNLGSIDRGTDIFAMGIVLHELLTGVCLFPRTNADAAYAAILLGEIARPRATHPDVPEGIDAVVRRALSRARADRFETADDMRRALVEAQEQHGIADVDVAAVGAWVHGALPPAWTKHGLELEIAGGRVDASPLDVAANAATLAPRRPAQMAEDPSQETSTASPLARPTLEPRRRRGVVVGVVSSVVVALALLVTLARMRPTPVMPEPRVAAAEPAQTPPLPPSARVEQDAVPRVEPSASDRAPRSPPPQESPALRRRPRAPAGPSAPTAPSSVTPAITPPDEPPKKPDVYEQM